MPPRRRYGATALLSPIAPLLAAGAALVAFAAGCGGGAGSSGVAELTKRLPQDARTYDVADFASIRDERDLDDEADPLDPSEDVLLATIGAPALGALPASDTDPDVIAALDLGLARSAATATGPAGMVTLVGTDADTGEIGSQLGDLGFEDRGGVLVREDSPSFLLDVGAIFAAKDPDALRDLPEDPADEVPDTLLEELDAPFVEVGPGTDCVRESAVTAEADGSGELVYLVDGGADASGLDVDDVNGFEFGDPEVDGDLIKLPVAYAGEGATGIAARDAQASLVLTYEC